MTAIAKLNESALLAAGLPKDVVEALRHILVQAGKVKGATTLPELASMTDGLTPIVNALQITTTQTNATVADLAVELAAPPYSDHNLVMRLNDMQTEMERGHIERAELLRAIALQNDSAASLDFNIADLSRRIKQLEDAQP